jgi:hypothetical protein
MAMVGSRAFVACGGDACRSGEYKCDGDAILGCGSPGDVSGARDFTELDRGCGADQCLDLERDGLHVAVCSTTGAPDARCPATSVFASICVDDHTMLSCERGYGSNETKCEGACVAPSSSATGTTGAFCSLDTAPSPACAGANPQTCDGDTIIECTRGWVTKRTVCGGAAPHCVINSNPVWQTWPYCASDASCSDADGARCDGNIVRGCIGGRTVAMDCGADGECTTFGPLEGRTDATCDVRCKHVRDDVCLDP